MVRNIIFVSLVVLILILIPGGLFWYKNNIVTVATEEATQSVDGGDICRQFKEFDYNISCEEAIAIALADTPGVVQKISIGQMLNISSSASLPEDLRENLWLVDIKAAYPYFDTVFQREIEFLRIGVELNEHRGIHKKPLDINDKL